ncbi:MAG: hypothetical protein SF182_15985 [Deltaproteobacteria bacterium]|nr:hypothetical protein [Deltaproteobacteria bacterium]
MRFFWRYPALPIGLVLVVLGVGNWAVSHSKLAEYAARAAAPQAIDSGSLADFRRLSPRTNARVLDGLHRGPSAADIATAKRDFYAVLATGGRLIAGVGLLLAAVGAFQHWRARRPSLALAPG